MKHVLFIGMNPPKNKMMTQGQSYKRFCRWLETLGTINNFAFTNLHWDPDWDKKTVDHAFLEAQIGEHNKLVAWGGLVSQHLTKMGLEHFMFPHPSPLNRQTNDQKFLQLKLKELKLYMES